MTTNEHEIHSVGGRRRQIRLMQMIFAGAATVAALATLFGAQHRPTALSAPVAGGFATDDTNFVNDQGQTSGDIFTQNAQDQN
jgi:hypothetical protein